MTCESSKRMLTMGQQQIFMPAIARRQRMRVVIDKVAPRFPSCKSATLARNSSQLSLSPSNDALVKTQTLPLFRSILFNQKDNLFCDIVNTNTHRRHHYHQQSPNIVANKRTFCTYRIYQQPTCRLDANMIGKYYARCMSTVKSGLFGPGVEQVDCDQVTSSLLSNPKTNKTVTIKACAKLYSDLIKTRPILYSGAPKDGIQFEVQYYDSLDLLGPSTSQQKLATVCMLHGAPGHYKDFASLINYLTSKGVRVIAPNFPDYSATLKHSFRHSPRERSDFLIEFFNSIGVAKYDMIIGHSSAVYTMFELLNNITKRDNNDTSAGGIQVKSLGLFSTPSHVLPHNLAVTPIRLFTLKLFDYPLLRPFMMTFVKTFVRLQGIRNRVDENKIENLLIAASAMGYSDHERMADHLSLVHRNKIPILLVYGTRDRLITRNNYIQLERDLGIVGDDQVKCYKSDGTLERAAKNPSELVEVSRFESGGHYTFQKYSSQVNEDVYDFLTRRIIEPSQSVEITKL